MKHLLPSLYYSASAPFLRRARSNYALRVYNNCFHLAAPRLKELKTAVAAVGGGFHKEYERFFLPSIERFLLFVLDLPASREYHHPGRGGLFLHSTEAAVMAARIYRRTPRILDNEERWRHKQKWQYAYFAWGLLHDLGKVLNFKVRPKEFRPLKYKDTLGGVHLPVWDPDAQGLLDFVAEHGPHQVQQLELPYSVHEVTHLPYILRVIPPGCREWMGETCFTSLCDALHPKGGLYLNKAHFLDIRAAVKSVDSESAKKDHKEQPGVKSQDHSFIEDFLEEMRKQYESGAAAPNQKGRSWFFVGTEYTACVSPRFIEREIIPKMDNLVYTFLNKSEDIVRNDVQRRLVGEKVAKCFSAEKNGVWRVKFAGKKGSIKGEKDKGLSVMFLSNNRIWRGSPPPVFEGKWEIIEGEKFAWIHQGEGRKDD